MITFFAHSGHEHSEGLSASAILIICLVAAIGVTIIAMILSGRKSKPVEPKKDTDTKQ